MVEWFGKKGVCWHGAKVSFYDPATNRIMYYFENQIQTGEGETGFINLKVLRRTVENHSLVYPQYTQLILRSDGASYYHGVEFTAGLSKMGKATGVVVIDHHIGESYGGKSGVDRYFT